MASEKEVNVRVSEGVYRTSGPFVQRDGINFCLAAEGEDAVLLILYRRGSHEEIGEFPMYRSPLIKNRWTLKISGVRASDIEYNFKIGREIVTDPCARLVCGREKFGDLSSRTEHQIRAAIPYLKFDWSQDVRLHIPYEDVIAYGLHVRGFTKSRYSKVRNKGTFRGITEKIPYLNSLGVNLIMLLPAYDFEDAPNAMAVVNLPSYAENAQMKNTSGHRQVRHLNYWGFSEAAYFAPKASFAAGKHPDIEFKEMVLALHKAGIEVIMDFSFPDKIDVEYIISCLTNWITEYHVDGFRLMVRPELAQILAKCPSLSGVKLISAWFDTDYIFGSVHPAVRRLADMNDGFKNAARRILKSDEGMAQEFVDRSRANSSDKAVINYLTGHDGFTLGDMVSYDRKHNEENGEMNRDGAGINYSWNCGAEGPTRKKSVLQLRMRQMKNAMAELYLSQGTPLIMAGDEFGNSQGGNNNPYGIDSEVTWVDWKSERTNAQLADFVKELIALRKKYRILHMNRPMTGNDQISCGYPDFSCHSGRAWYGAFDYQSRSIGVMYCGMHAGEEEFIYIAYNFYWDEQEFGLPYLPKGMKWETALSTAGEALKVKEKTAFEETSPGNTPIGKTSQIEAAKPGDLPDTEIGRSITVPGRSVAVLIGRKMTEAKKADSRLPGEKQKKEAAGKKDRA